MRKKFTFIISILISFVGVGGYFLYDYIQFYKVEKEAQINKAVIDVSKVLHKYWKEGDFNLETMKEQWSCFDFNHTYINSLAIRCNPDYINCLLEKRPQILSSNSGINFTPSKMVRRKNSYILELGHKENKWQLSFEDTCHEVYLPKREYAFGPFDRKKINQRWIWDNLNQHIFIDQFMVTNQKVIEWAKTKNKRIEIADRGMSGKYYAPNTSLKYKEMVEYCADRKKQLLTSVVYDAATFFPESLEEKFPINHIHSGYPWVKKRTSSFLSKIRGKENYKLTKKNCSRVFSVECINILSQKSMSTDSVSWMGFYQILGGELEVTRNPIFKRRNLKASSNLFKASSRHHELGRRVFWNGEGFFSKDFNWRLDDPDDTQRNSFGVGFRCMREVAHE